LKGARGPERKQNIISKKKKTHEEGKKRYKLEKGNRQAPAKCSPMAKSRSCIKGTRKKCKIGGK